MWEFVRSLVTDGSTVLLTTQYLEEADALADEITVIDHGQVIAHDTPDGLKRIVGGQRLKVRPTDVGRLDEVHSVLAAVGDGPPESPGRGVLTVPVQRGAKRTIRHAVSLARRNLIKTMRTPEQLIDVTIQPFIFLLLFVYVFG